MAEIRLNCAYWMFSYRAVRHSAVAALKSCNSGVVCLQPIVRFLLLANSHLQFKNHYRCSLVKILLLNEICKWTPTWKVPEAFCWGNPGDANVRINEYKLIKVKFFRAVSPWKCSAIATIKTTTGSLLKYGQHRWIIVKSSSLHRRLSRRVVSGAVIPWPLISMRYRLT